MKTSGMLSMFLAAISVPAAAGVIVESATGDWRNLPQLSQRGYDHLSGKMQAKLLEIAERQHCPSLRLVDGRLDFRIGFAVQYASDGTLARLVLPKLDCPEAEGVAGGAAEAFESQLRQLIRAGRRQLVVDMTGVSAIDSAGIRALVRGHTSAQRASGSLRLAGARPAVKRVLELSHVASVFEPYDTVEPAGMVRATS